MEIISEGSVPKANPRLVGTFERERPSRARGPVSDAQLDYLRREAEAARLRREIAGQPTDRVEISFKDKR